MNEEDVTRRDEDQDDAEGEELLHHRLLLPRAQAPPLKVEKKPKN